MILEAIVTTLSASGELNIAPMGPLIGPNEKQFELRPFETSQTYKNLLANPFGVLHISDDVMLFAATAINQLKETPAYTAAPNGKAKILNNCCHWMEFSATELPNNSSRKALHCTITAEGSGRRFFGFNRAKHAVLEATILATRLDFIPFEEIQSQFKRFATIVEKTGGEAEVRAFEMLTTYIHSPPD